MEYFFTPAVGLPGGVGFEFFGAAHFAWLSFCAVFGALLCLAYCRGGALRRKAIRRGIGFAVLALELLRALWLALCGAYSVYYLPLHLCSMSVFFCFAHSLRPGETLGNFLYAVCMPGALAALLFPDWIMHPALSLSSCISFLSHTMIAVYPLMQVLGRELRPRVGLLWRCFGLLLLLAAGVYAFDRAFNANYMFLLVPAPGSPLEWFCALWGNPGYLLGYFPMLAAVWCALYLPFRKKPDKTRKSRRA